MWPFTCSDPSGRSGNSSTAWTPTTWKPTTGDRTPSDSPLTPGRGRVIPPVESLALAIANPHRLLRSGTLLASSTSAVMCAQRYGRADPTPTSGGGYGPRERSTLLGRSDSLLGGAFATRLL